MPGIIQETQKRSKEMIEQSMKRIWPGVLTAVVAGAILWLTLAPQPLPEADIPVFEGADKVVHGLMFGGLVFAMVFDREVWLMRHRLSPDSRKERYFIALFFLLAVLAGGGIELLQGAMGVGTGFPPDCQMSGRTAVKYSCPDTTLAIRARNKAMYPKFETGTSP